MKRVAFTLKLKPGCLAEYRRRHDEIWPEHAALIRASGISDFSIFHDAATGTLLCVQDRADDAAAEAMRDHPIALRWAAQMSAFLEVGEDGRPARTFLEPVFHLE